MTPFRNNLHITFNRQYYWRCEPKHIIINNYLNCRRTGAWSLRMPESSQRKPGFESSAGVLTVFFFAAPCLAFGNAEILSCDDKSWKVRFGSHPIETAAAV